MMLGLLGVPASLLVLGGCGDERTPEAEADQRERDAQRVLDELEGKVLAWRALAPEERERQAGDFGPRLERALDDVKGTTSQNKVLLWLAGWRMTYANGKGVAECLDRLEASPSLKVKGLGERLRVEYLLKAGDLPQARKRAQVLVERIPEFQPVLNLVFLHEMVGQPPPLTTGKNLTGGPDDPATRPEAWLVYVFTDVLDDENQYQLKRWLAEAARPEYAGAARIVCVTSESTPLGALTKSRGIPGSERMDVLWASPAAGGDAEAWQRAWKLSPRQSVSVLLGPPPKRTIMAILDRPEDLRAVLSK